MTRDGKIHSEAYYRRRKQLRRKYIAAASVGILVLCSLIIYGIYQNQLKLSVQKQPESNIAESTPVAPENEVLISEDKTIEDLMEKPAEGDTEGVKILAPEVSTFADGYEAVTDAQTQTITSEEVISSNAILIDVDRNVIVAQKDAFTPVPPASMTKILTVLTAAEHITEEELDSYYTMTPEITNTVYVHDDSVVGYSNDEMIPIRELFFGTILPSGADAALALADEVSGSEDVFVGLMNDKLAELGLSDQAHFTNCIGNYDENHYSSMYAMAMILKAAVENDLAREALSLHHMTTSQTAQHPDGIDISNWFLRRIEDKDCNGTVLCAKTGFVNEAGCCAASYLVGDDGGHYICVTANAWSSWRAIYDHVAIYQQYVGSSESSNQ